MKKLTIIQRKDGEYIDSREVAEFIGKRHKELARDIRGYIKMLCQITKRGFALSDFFVESSYIDRTGRKFPCYLLTKMACELCASRLSGEKGALFTVAYVRQFNRFETEKREREMEDIRKKSETPRLKVFNDAVKNVLRGFSFSQTSSKHVMDFLQGAYEPFGISVTSYEDDESTFTATEIAVILGIYSESGRPHGHAVSAIIDKIDVSPRYVEVAPYGLIGVAVRYDYRVAELVRDWIVKNDFPTEVRYNDREYHIFYSSKLNPESDVFEDVFDGDCDDDFDLYSEWESDLDVEA